MHRTLAGLDTPFSTSTALPGDVAAREIEPDLRGWLTALLYSLSADRGLPSHLAGVELTALPNDKPRAFVRSAMCVKRGGTFGGLLEHPAICPPWLDSDDLDILVDGLERGGLVAALSYYTNAELDWESLGRYEGRPVTVPALYIGGERDL